MREILFKAKRIDNGEWIEGVVVIGNAVDDRNLLQEVLE